MERLVAFEELRPRGILYSKVTLWRLEKSGRFPRRIKVGPQRVAWIESEIDGWIAERIRARDEAAA